MDLNQHFPVRINTNRRYTSCLDKTCHEPQVMNANWYQPIADPQADSTWKIDGSSLRQTLTVVWHSGQFFDLPRLERGVESGLNRFHYRGLVRCGIIFHLFQSLLFSKPIAFFSHMSQIAEPTTLPRQHLGETWWNLQGFVWFCFFCWWAMPWKESHRNSAPDEILEQKSFVAPLLEGCFGGRMGRLVGFATTGLDMMGWLMGWCRWSNMAGGNFPDKWRFELEDYIYINIYICIYI